jgi:hypothetical protein
MTKTIEKLAGYFVVVAMESWGCLVGLAAIGYLKTEGIDHMKVIGPIAMADCQQ